MEVQPLPAVALLHFYKGASEDFFIINSKFFFFYQLGIIGEAV